MRDRRNTILSISSSGSTHSGRSSLSEKFGFSLPPSSPTLPEPVTKSHRRRLRYNRFALLKLLALGIALLLLVRAFLCWSPEPPPPWVGDAVSAVGQVGVPTANIVVDVSGHAKWTGSIPESASFPLKGSQYAHMCREGEVLREQLQQSSRFARIPGIALLKHLDRRRRSYYSHDWTYLDVSAVERSRGNASSWDTTANVCNTSMTFVIESDEASFGKTLLMLWLSYGLARHEKRAFFVDDSRWAYGKYSTYFAPPPAETCAPPTPHHIVPCPHQADHILVSAATAQWTFGSLFDKEFALKQIFQFLREGYEDLFTLVGDDAGYAKARIADLRNDAAAHGSPVVGMQIRRGDLHPHEYQFSRDYLPLERYAAEARSLSQSLNTKHDTSDARDETAASLLLASDDPNILTSSDLAHAASPFPVQRAQERIQLATKATLDRTSPVEPLREPGSAYVKHVQENAGWEGGFFSALFYSLGGAQTQTLVRLSRLPADGEAAGVAVPEQAMRMRELVGRAYLLDLAVLGASEGVVCAVSSAGCRVLGVMMGWEAVRGGRWVNVDDGRAWSWEGRRVGAVA
ncbi:hypothetical protein LTR53_011617 [Teratosphaeriaceae sp. CCFEE 6253]|nr:hypothetical protein LTR53_011617 [Teratosphaeriaceae sp. CCFEE 6253]